MAVTTGGTVSLAAQILEQMDREMYAAHQDFKTMLDRMDKGVAMRPVFTYNGRWPLKSVLDVMGDEVDRIEFHFPPRLRWDADAQMWVGSVVRFPEPFTVVVEPGTLIPYAPPPKKRWWQR